MALISRPTTEARAKHDHLVSEVAELLQKQEWDVSAEPLAGNLRPDLVAKDPEGNRYVIEIEAGQAHLGAVAQVEHYRNSLRDRVGDQAKGILVLTEDVPPQLAEVAERAGIELVSAPPSSDGAPESLASRLSALAQP
jgi:RecB family endonuclease NucS